MDEYDEYDEYDDIGHKLLHYACSVSDAFVFLPF